MAIYLGIDGGGSGCRAAVADAEGRILGRGSAASANIWTDLPGAAENILAAARDALAEGAPGAREAEVAAVLGLAGANVPEAARGLARLLPFGRVAIESDAVVALKGALGDADGITAAIGTGSVFGAQRGGAITMIGGWGLKLGDHGGGAALGRALCVDALLAHDGEIAATPLLEGLVARHGGPAGLVVWGTRASPADFARLVPELLAAAAAGDPAAEAILVRAEAEVARAIDRLGRDGALPVTFLGGLGGVFATRLAARYAGRIRPARGTGLDGALLMARRLA
ncbi:MAG: ATPase [Rhodovulum sulfidophilum]|uniref:ATPase n=1 Tax=Rhodovulum sulfidophilum TaxID=35806 RepID=A0A2W5N1I3_RHOSU|nr:MAG: ATPase [Rhodovulum sulfidophilum]